MQSVISKPKKQKPNPNFVIADDLSYAAYQNGSAEHPTADGGYCRVSFVPRENGKGDEINPHYHVRKNPNGQEFESEFLFSTWRQVEKFIRGQLSFKELKRFVY